MSKLLRFTLFSFRDLLASAGPSLLLLALVALAAYYWADPTPPRTVIMSTGQENSAYVKFGQAYADALKNQGIQVKQAASEGSLQNLERLNAGKVDIAFVQSGTTHQEAAERQGLVSLGSLFIEPIWIFYRDSVELNQLTQIRGLKVNVGVESTGVPRLVRQLLKVNGNEIKVLWAAR